MQFELIKTDATARSALTQSRARITLSPIVRGLTLPVRKGFSDMNIGHIM